MDVYGWAPYYPGYDIKRLAPYVDRFFVRGLYPAARARRGRRQSHHEEPIDVRRQRLMS